jgi:acyl-coenzyme A thioesterase PaaI-like protein
VIQTTGEQMRMSETDERDATTGAATEAKRLVFADASNRCFGCSPHNELGLRMRFVEISRGVVESRWTAPEHVCGMDGIVHGGVQATVIDETMGAAIHAMLEGTPGGDGPIATVEFELRYRRPTPIGVELVVRGTYLRADGRNHFVEGAILSATGERLTEAKARWVEVPRRR